MQPIRTVKLGEICEFVYGKALTQNQRNETGSFPVYGSGGIAGYHDEILADGPCIIVGRKGSVGVVHYSERSCWPIDTVYYVKASGVHTKFLYYQLGTLELNRLDKSTTIPGLNRNDAYAKSVILPDLDTQRHIAAVLDRADALRQKDRQLLTYYEQLPQAVFLELFGDEREIIDRYDPINLCEVADIVSGVTKNTKQTGAHYVEVPYMRVANVQDGRIDLTEIKTISVPPSDLQKYRLVQDDILLTEGGDPDKLGRGSVWHNEITDCIHQNHIFRVRPNQSVIDPTFLSFLIGSKYGKRYFLKAAKQTTGIASINMQQLKRFPAVLPPLDEQKQFATSIREIGQQRKLAQAQVAASEALFQSLLHEYFGYVRS